MKKNRGHTTNTSSPGTVAEAKVTAQEPGLRQNLDAERLLQELQALQIKLQSQNKELIKTRAEIGTALSSCRDICAHAPVACCTLDREGTILKANTSAALLFGVMRSSLIKMSITAFFAAGERQDFDRFLEATFAGPDKQTGEFLFLTPGGQALSAQIVGALSVDGTECLATIHDITAANLAKETLLESSNKLPEPTAGAEVAKQARIDLLVMMSHEIRTPVSGIIGTTNMLLDTQLGTRQKEFVNSVRRSGEYLLEIVNDILDFSRIEAGQLRLERANFELGNLLGGVVELLEARAVHRGISLAVEIDPGVRRWLRADGGRLRQVLLNLAGDAIKLTERGGVVIRVRQLARKNAEFANNLLPVEGVADVHSPSRARVQLRFEVQSSGVGIPPKDQSRIFEPFTQTNLADTKRREGTGLGLAISRRIVELLGGRIGVESVSGKGSVFWFEVEFDEGVPGFMAERLPATAPDPAANGNLAAENSPLRILVAEDHPVSRRLALLIIEKLGYPADVATNGREAVDLWEQHRHGVILMDCQMPEMDGFEATRKIRTIEAACREGGSPPVRIIALTANALSGERQRCLAAGMDDCLTKPLRSQTMRSVLGISAKDTVGQSRNTGTHSTPQIAELVGRVGPKAAADLVELFLQDTAQRLVDLRRVTPLQTGSGSQSNGCSSQAAGSAAEGSGAGAMPVENLKALAVGAHGLAGGCGLFGLERMRELGLGLEAIAAKLGDIPGMVGKLEEEFSSLRPHLLQEIRRLRGPVDLGPTREGS